MHAQPKTSTVHARINARQDVEESRAYLAATFPTFKESAELAPLILVSIIVEARNLKFFALTNPYQDLLETASGRLAWVTCYARGPLNQFLSRFQRATKERAQEMSTYYWFF